MIRELLEHGYDVLSLDRVTPIQRLCPSWIVDLRKSGDLYEALKEAYGVVHLGAYAMPDLAPDSEVFSNNVTATYNVLNAASDRNVSKVVIVSSSAAFGFTYASRPLFPEYLPLDENHPCRPQDPYGLSKLVGEKTADSFAAAHDMTISSLRFPGVNYDLSYQNFPEKWKNPTARLGSFWSYIDARDAAMACRLGIEAGFQGHDIFIVAAPTSTMNRETNELIREYAPEVKGVRQGLKGNWSTMDSSKAERILGITAQHVWEIYLKTSEGKR